MFIALLLVLPEFLFNTTFYFSLFAAVFGIFTYFHKIHLDKISKENESARKQREEFNERIKKVEDVDKTALPRFESLEKDFKSLTETVKNHHELRLTGIVTDITSLRDNIELRFKSTEKDIAEIKKCFDKLEEKFDKLECKLDNNNKELLAEIMKLHKNK